MKQTSVGTMLTFMKVSPRIQVDPPRPTSRPTTAPTQLLLLQETRPRFMSAALTGQTRPLGRKANESEGEEAQGWVAERRVYARVRAGGVRRGERVGQPRACRREASMHAHILVVAVCVLHRGRSWHFGPEGGGVLGRDHDRRRAWTMLHSSQSGWGDGRWRRDRAHLSQ